MDDGAIAIPLKLKTPSSYNSDIHARVVEAGLKGLGYDAERGVEVELALSHLFIRPGAWMWSPAWCTMNFIYGSPGAYQIGSAGHCGNAGQTVVLRTTVPGQLSGTTFVYVGDISVSVNGGVGNDYLLANILPLWQPYVDANVAGVWGPEGGAYTGSPILIRPVALKHFGHGLAVGTGGTPRAGVSAYMTSNTFYMDSAAAPGDSGSPVLLAGDATYPLGQGVGVLTHLVIVGPLGSVVAGTRLGVVPATIVDGDIDPRP